MKTSPYPSVSVGRNLFNHTQLVIHLSSNRYFFLVIISNRAFSKLSPSPAGTINCEVRALGIANSTVTLTGKSHGFPLYSGTSSSQSSRHFLYVFRKYGFPYLGTLGRLAAIGFTGIGSLILFIRDLHVVESSLRPQCICHPLVFDLHCLM